MINQLIATIIGSPILLLFAGFMNFHFLPDWLVYRRVRNSKKRYFFMTYLAFVAIIPVLYFGGNMIHENELGSRYLIILIAVPMGFLVKFFLLKGSKVTFN